MRVTVIVKPGAKAAKVEVTDESHLQVWVREPAKENKANFAVLEAVAAHFGVGLSQVALVSGRQARIKVVEIRL